MSPRRTSRLLGLSVVLAVALVVVGQVVGWSTVLNWAGARWRLDIGAPVVSRPYEALEAEPLVRLVAAGDVGTGGEAEYATAARMDRLEADRQFDALVLLGDNVYPDGDPTEVQAKVLDPFAGVLDGPTSLVAALGNHDVETDDGLSDPDALGAPARWYSTRLGPVTVVVVDSTRATDPDQLAWLDKTLGTTDTRWTVVVQHHPPYSAGYHGSHEPSRNALVPIFERHGVDLVLSGHDHDYQRSEMIGGVTYVVSGGAATLRPTGRADFTVMSASVYNFVELVGYEDRLDVRAIDQEGRMFDTFSLLA